MSQRIRIKLKSYDHNLVDKSAEKIVKTVKLTGAHVRGPIPLPTNKKIFTVNRSTFVNKKSREQFELSSYKRLLDIDSTSSKTIDALVKLELPSGVDVQIKVSYCVDFLEEYKDKWFCVENYVKYLCDRQRSLLKREAKKHTIEDFYANATDIVRNIVLNLPKPGEEQGDTNRRPGRLFKENGMLVHDVEVLSIGVEAGIARILERHQTDMITKTLELSDAAKKMEVVAQLADFEKQETELKHKNEIYRLELNQTLEKSKLDASAEIAAKKRAQEEAVRQAEADMQKLLDQIQAAKLERDKKEDAARIETERQLVAIEKEKHDAYAATVAKIMESVSPQLVAAMTSKANADTLKAVSQGMAPYAIANGESIADTVNKLMRGTTLESVLENIEKYKVQN